MLPDGPDKSRKGRNSSSWACLFSVQAAKLPAKDQKGIQNKSVTISVEPSQCHSW